MQKCDDNTEFEENKMLKVNFDNGVLLSSYTSTVRAYSITL